MFAQMNGNTGFSSCRSLQIIACYLESDISTKPRIGDDVIAGRSGIAPNLKGAFSPLDDRKKQTLLEDRWNSYDGMATTEEG
uniref:Uncharacterized protein n=1 Tax=Onchocerca volvulus TaxID=6282 RepID=A0A8R1TYM9_ONCVO